MGSLCEISLVGTCRRIVCAVVGEIGHCQEQVHHAQRSIADLGHDLQSERIRGLFARARNGRRDIVISVVLTEYVANLMQHNEENRGAEQLLGQFVDILVRNRIGWDAQGTQQWRGNVAALPVFQHKPVVGETLQKCSRCD